LRVIDSELLIQHLAATADRIKFGPRVVAVDGTGDQQLDETLASHFELEQSLVGLLGD
jgi:hypothetical protein